jgi:hypothetical protein
MKINKNKIISRYKTFDGLIEQQTDVADRGVEIRLLKPKEFKRRALVLIKDEIKNNPSKDRKLKLINNINEVLLEV